MTQHEIISALMSALEASNLDQAKALMTDDFQISGPFPEPMGKDQWLGMQASMKNAFPDWAFNLERMEDKGDHVTAYYQITGTHEGDLDLSPMGLPAIPPTSKGIKMPPEHADFSFEGDLIKSMVVTPAPDGGLPGLLKQIGVDMPG